MDRIIQPYPGSHPGPPARTGAAGAPALPTHPPKSPADFARALRRRIWLVLLVSMTVGIPGAAFVLNEPNRYRVTAQLEINPPKFDTGLAGLMNNPGVATYDA